MHNKTLRQAIDTYLNAMYLFLMKYFRLSMFSILLLSSQTLLSYKEPKYHEDADAYHVAQQLRSSYGSLSPKEQNNLILLLSKDIHETRKFLSSHYELLKDMHRDRLVYYSSLDGWSAGVVLGCIYGILTEAHREHLIGLTEKDPYACRDVLHLKGAILSESHRSRMKSCEEDIPRPWQPSDKPELHYVYAIR